jgi:hypothetical protein
VFENRDRINLPNQFRIKIGIGNNYFNINKLITPFLDKASCFCNCWLAFLAAHLLHLSSIIPSYILEDAKTKAETAPRKDWLVQLLRSQQHKSIPAAVCYPECICVRSV